MCRGQSALATHFVRTGASAVKQSKHAVPAAATASNPKKQGLGPRTVCTGALAVGRLSDNAHSASVWRCKACADVPVRSAMPYQRAEPARLPFTTLR
jgi:hypothetical protein